MRILFTGAAPWCNSGYGKPLRYLLPRLIRAGHECALAPFFGYVGKQRMVDVGGEKIRLFPPATSLWFNDIIEHHAEVFGADVVITLQDIWILEGWGKRGFTWCPWMPIDCDPPTLPVLNALEGAHTPLSFSKWGRDRLHEVGWPTARYMPPGVDLDVYCPGDQAEARKASGLPDDGLIIGMVAGNSSYPSRKSFPEVLQAWQRWKQGGGDGVLYMHTTLNRKRTKGIDLGRMLATLDLKWSPVDNPDRTEYEAASVLFPSQYRIWQDDYSDAALADIYRSMDALFSPSMSEGFGIPIIEAQACGVPVVTLGFSSMKELTFAGQCLEPVQLAWEDRGGWRGVADAYALFETIGWIAGFPYMAERREPASEKARAGVQPFAWDTIVADHWLPFLAELEAEL